MPPKSKFTFAQIIETAFQILRREGWSAISARTIAKEMQASTMPLYSSLKSMDELELELRKKTLAVLSDYQSRSYTENPFLNMGVGYVMFAKEETKLFRFFYLDRPHELSSEEQHQNKALIVQKTGQPLPYELFGKVSPHNLDAISIKSWLFTHGLAMAVSSGSLSLSQQEIVKLLQEAGGAFIAWETKS